jgi:eukaryotic-like serine/threonine-protein kinase
MATPDAPTRKVGGRYRLDRSIGSGGMGTVWAGTDELLGRPVAIKEVRFPDQVGDRETAELKERTLREARTTARLNHPSVITTYDVVEDEGRPYIVMELLDARSLGSVVRDDGPLPARRVAEIGLDLVGALESAHAEGIVHRDVKPSNVLITPDGRAVLTDFGIATMAGDPALTSTGVVLGSPAYMPPERARGRKPGPESDLWSLGATLFTAVEGRPPYDSEDPLGTLTAVVADPVPTPRVGGPLREAILGLLTKDPDERIGIPAARQLLQRAAAQEAEAPTTAAVPVALDRGERTEAFVGGGGAPLRQEPDRSNRSYVEPPPHKRNGLLIAALLLGLAIVGGLLAGALLGDSPNDPTATPEKKRDTSPTGSTGQSPAESTPDESPTEEQATESAEPPDEPAGVPAGFETYTDPSGFTVAVPEGWTREQNGTAVDFDDPSSAAFLRIDRTREPKDDPVADWERQEKSLQARYDSYQRIRIEPVDFRGWPAADWEFTLGPSAHVLNRGFVTDEDHGYALYLSSPEASWSDNLRAFEVAARAFEPAP